MDSRVFSQKLGGKMSDQLESARASSVAAAYLRLASASNNNMGVAEVCEEPDPDDYESNIHEEQPLNVNNPNRAQLKVDGEPDPDDFSDNQKKIEPSLYHNESGGSMESERDSRINESKLKFEPDPDDVEMQQFVPHSRTDEKLASTETSEEPDPDDMEVSMKQSLVVELEPENSQLLETLDSKVQLRMTLDEPDPDDSEVNRNDLGYGNISRPNHHGNSMETMEDQSPQRKAYKEPDPDDSQANKAMAEPDPDDNLSHKPDTSTMQTDEPDPDDEELQRIQDPVTVVCNRLQKAIEMLRSEANAKQSAIVLQTLFKIIRYSYPSSNFFTAI